ncbi:MAG: tripartite tricarboxylate transporter substrate binding protein [Betaproteobacteria bacterium]|nr:tripartite tricarboxylate transporter substrate binding protein [Betaproteobacteria bacterium]
MKTETRIGIAALLAPGLATAPLQGAAAQAYPNKPVRLIVASGAGGGLDFVARLVGPKLGENLGQTVVVDNRAGASGSIAAELAAHSTPDGYTLILLSASLVVYGAVNKTRYDLFRDFAPVSQVAAGPYLLTVTPSLPVKSVKDLVAHAKATPSKLNYPSTGNASLAHLATEWFAIITGAPLVHVPYKGVGAALPDMLSGQIHMSLLSVASVYGHVRAKRLRALAIATRKRAKMAPEIPTMIEAGVPGYAVTQWHGLLAPRGTPKAIVDGLQGEVVKALQHPEVATRLAADGTEAVGSTPAQFAAHLRFEHDTWSKVAKQTGLRVD